MGAASAGGGAIGGGSASAGGGVAGGGGAGGGGGTTEPCALTVPTGLEVSEGGRTLVELQTSPPDSPITLGTVPPGVRTEWVGQGRLQLRLPYGVSEARLPLTATCPTGTAQAELVVRLRALRWSQAAPAWNPGVDGPPEREYGQLWLDSQNPNRLLVFAGFHYRPRQFTPSNDAWALDLDAGTWRSLGEPAGAPKMGGFRVAEVPDSGVVLSLGGIGTDGTVPARLARLDLHAAPPTWVDEPLAPGQAGVGAYQPAFFFDAKRDRWLAICGADGVVGLQCDVKAFTRGPTGGTWRRVTVASGPKPAPRAGFFWAYEPSGDRFVMFGGDGSVSGGGQILQDTWALELGDDVPRWKLLSAQETPALGRRNGAYAFDPIGLRLFTWGGTPDGATTLKGLHVLDLEKGFERWHTVAVPMPPPDRTSGQAVYEPIGRRVLAGFGNDGAIYADLWSLSL